jgi:FkbM family methyltransferase
MFPPRKAFANKDIHHLSYRPAFELSGELCRAIRERHLTLSQPLVVVDVGAAQALDPRWEIFGEACVQIGFEPDREECKRLAALYATEGPGKTRKIFEPVALWHAAEVRTLNVTRDPDASSFYEPNAAFFERLPDPTLQQVVARVPVEAVPLDQYRLPLDGTIDAIKLDVQAAELDVMRGAQRHLDDGVLAVIAETLFTPHYIDQPWFGDFDAFMRSHGYQIFDIDLRRWRRRALPRQFDGVRVGGISYGDALYLKDPIAFDQARDNPTAKGRRFCRLDLEREKVIKLMALAEYFSVPDYALEVADHAAKRRLLTSDEVADLAASLRDNKIVRWNDRNAMPR